MKHLRLLLLILIFLPASIYAAKDSVCEAPLKYEVLEKGSNTDDFLWITGDRKYNIYYKGADVIVERKRKGTLWLVKGLSFASYPHEEMYIDSAYFQNISEFPDKELIIKYSLFSLQPGTNAKSKHMMIVDINERKIVLNVALYDFKIGADENGKVIDYLYEANVDVSLNLIKVESSEDSDIDNPATQLDDGIYHRRGHCFVKH
ncbi:MAG: hypothetical protein JWO03_1960 [Bacteroidetes bacterium]|nr:hypothetical protein [Bacteroidota bacterium]